MAQSHPQARLELGHPERFGDEIVRPSVERLHLAPLVAIGGEHHDRDLGELPDAPADVEPVQIGQAQVQDHQIGRGESDLGHGLGPGASDEDLVAARGEPDAKGLEQRGIVVDHQDLRHDSASGGGGHHGARRAR